MLCTRVVDVGRYIFKCEEYVRCAVYVVIIVYCYIMEYMSAL